MKKLLITTLLTVVAATAVAQETHYHRALRSQDTRYGLTQEPHFDGSGMFWSRTRNVDDVAVVKEMTPEDSVRCRKEFIRLCELAYDAYLAKDYYRTILYGDSALAKNYHTPDLYYFMGVSFEQYTDYDNAEEAYRLAAQSGYMGVPDAYPAFRQRMKQRKAEAKRLKKEAKQQRK